MTDVTRFIPFDNSYARLPDAFFARLEPTPVVAPTLVHLNEPLARDLGIDPVWLRSEAGIAALAGNAVPLGAEPLAMAYAGHQFGQFVPQLGDGRAILLGEVVDARGVRQDIQLKGAGRTPFSRGGDGRNWLGPVLREYVVSEAMAALGVPTTRALAAVATGEIVQREQALPGAVLTRIARSHVRVGTFQYFTARRDDASVRVLARFVAERHYPSTLAADAPSLALLDAVVAAQASLIAHWQSIGFIHGVMNTDNSSVTGDTIDYGPCAFMDEFDPAKVFSSIDQAGRYAYANQPHLAQWNLANLAQCLLPLIEADLGDSHENAREVAIAAAQASVDAFPGQFEAARAARFGAKLGFHEPRNGDTELVDALLVLMAEGQADFSVTFRLLSGASDAVRKQFNDPTGFDAWHARWLGRLADDPRAEAERVAAMKRVNPAVIPRNHQIEAMLRAAIDDDDFTLLDTLMATLANPFADAAEQSFLSVPPIPAERVAQTFCGT